MFDRKFYDLVWKSRFTSSQVSQYASYDDAIAIKRHAESRGIERTSTFEVRELKSMSEGNFVWNSEICRNWGGQFGRNFYVLGGKSSFSPPQVSQYASHDDAMAIKRSAWSKGIERTLNFVCATSELIFKVKKATPPKNLLVLGGVS